MARFPCPFYASTVSASVNQGTLFNPNGTSWRSYYGFKIELKNVTFNDSMFNDSGKLKSEAILVDNRNYSLAIGINNNWKFYIGTDNKLRFQYWFYDAYRDSWAPYWFYSTSSNINTSSYTKPIYNSSGYALNLAITKGHRYDISVTRPAAESMRFILKDLDDNWTGDYTYKVNAWNNNYSGKQLTIGSKGMSFDAATVAGYPYDSNCLHTISINTSTWDGSSNTTKIPVKSCNGTTYYMSYTNTSLHKLSVVLSDVAGLASMGKTTGEREAGKMHWQGAGTYNTTTNTWTKWYAEGDALDFPDAVYWVNETRYMNGPEGSEPEGYKVVNNCMFLGWSTTLGGDLTYNDWDTYKMGTSDITIYPRIATFGDLTATTGTGAVDYDGPGGGLKYPTIKPNAADATLGTVSAAGLKMWSFAQADEDLTHIAPAQAGMRHVQTTDPVVFNPSVAGTTYNILPGQNVRGRYMYNFYISSDPSKDISDYYIATKRMKYYFKLGMAIVKVNTILLPVPTPNGQLTYNGTEQTQAFNNFETEYMTVQYNKGTDAGTYTAIFTLKDTVVTHWADDSTDQKIVTWTINKKNVTPTFGTKTWTFDGNEHSTTVGLTGVVSGDICNPAVSGNAITDPGTQTVTVTGVDNPNYQLTGTTTTTLTVNKKDLTLTWSKYTKQYDSTILTPTLKVSGYVSGFEPVVTPSSSTSANIGYYTSTATMSGPNAKYYNLPADPTHQLQITPRPVKIVWAPISKNYDGTTLTSIPTITNLISGDTCNMTIINNVIGPAASSQIAEVTALSNNSYTLDGSTGRTQVIMIRDVLDPEHGKVYEYDPSRTGAGTAPYNHWILVM